MPKILEVHPPLKTLRLRTGLSLGKFLEKVNSKLEKPVTGATLVSWERRGTRNIDYIAALAYACELPISVISEAAKQDDEIILQNV